MKLNKAQMEGIARVTDNIATACTVAAIVGGLVDNKIGWETVALLFVAFIMLVFVGIRLRSSKGEHHGD